MHDTVVLFTSEITCYSGLVSIHLVSVTMMSLIVMYSGLTKTQSLEVMFTG